MAERLHGRVVAERIDVGSKSERVAVLLDVGERRYVLRRAGETAFGAASLEHLVGARISARGELHEQYFDVVDWAVEDDG